jgi:Tfp pilus assembly protein PilO
MEILQRRVLLGGIVGLVIILLVSIFFVFIPKTRAMKKIDVEISGLRKQIKENEAKAKDIPKLEARIGQLDAQQKEFMSKVIPRAEMLAIVQKLIKLGEPYHLTYTEIQPPGLDTVLRVDKPESPIQPIPFVFTVQARFVDVAQYLRSLKDFPYYLRTPEMEIIGKDEIRPRIEAKILFNLYVSSLVAESKL